MRPFLNDPLSPEEGEEGEDEDVYDAAFGMAAFDPPPPPPAGLTGIAFLDALPPTILAGSAGSVGALLFVAAYLAFFRQKSDAQDDDDDDEDEDEDDEYDDDERDDESPPERPRRRVASARKARKAPMRYDRVVDGSRNVAPADDDDDDEHKEEEARPSRSRGGRGARDDLSRYDKAPAAMDPHQTLAALAGQLGGGGQQEAEWNSGEIKGQVLD